MSEYKKYSNSVSGHPMMEEKKNPMSGATANYKTNFRNQDVTVSDNEEDKVLPTPVFAYPGTDKGVEGEMSGN